MTPALCRRVRDEIAAMERRDLLTVREMLALDRLRGQLRTLEAALGEEASTTHGLVLQRLRAATSGGRMTQRELAARAHLSPSYVSMILRDQREPSARQRDQLLAAAGYTMSILCAR